MVSPYLRIPLTRTEEQARAERALAKSIEDYIAFDTSLGFEKCPDDAPRAPGSPIVKYDYCTFGTYSDDTTPRAMLTDLMNDLAKSGWECFSVTNEQSGFFRKRHHYMLHCRRTK